MAAAERPESFGMRSTQDMYKDFPAAVRSSYPLYVRTAGPQARLLLTLVPPLTPCTWRNHGCCPTGGCSKHHHYTPEKIRLIMSRFAIFLSHACQFGINIWRVRLRTLWQRAYIVNQHHHHSWQRFDVHVFGAVLHGAFP